MIIFISCHACWHSTFVGFRLDLERISYFEIEVSSYNVIDTLSHNMLVSTFKGIAKVIRSNLNPGIIINLLTTTIE